MTRDLSAVLAAVTAPTELERLVSEFDGPVSYNDPKFLATLPDELFTELLSGILSTRHVDRRVVDAECERRKIARPPPAPYDHEEAMRPFTAPTSAVSL